MAKLQNKHRFYKSDIKPMVTQTTRLQHLPHPNSK